MRRRAKSASGSLLAAFAATHSGAFGAPVGELGIVQVNCFAPSLVVAELKVRPNIDVRHELFAFRHVRVVSVVRVRERLALRFAVR
eukprot:4027835-Pleurochrysis_carterae.AAC.1